MLTCIDWFAGIGGMRLAFARSGWQCVWSCEIDADARAVYAARFGAPPEAASILDVTAADVPDADCWVAGFPCQDLSVAGTRVGFAGDRSRARSGRLADRRECCLLRGMQIFPLGAWEVAMATAVPAAALWFLRLISALRRRRFPSDTCGQNSLAPKLFSPSS